MLKPKNAAANNMVVVAGKPMEVAVKGYILGKRVTVPLKLLQPGDKFAFQVEGELVIGTEANKTKDKEKGMTIVQVVGLEDGEFVGLICSAVLESALLRVPGGYVGKKFVALCGPKAPGKRYFQIELFELEGDGKVGA